MQEKIIKKIRELVPDTMKLDFGTVVQDKEQDDYQIVGCSGGCSKHKKCKSQFETCVYTNLYSLVREPNYSEDCGLISKDVISEEIENGYEIIGKPITLAVVLQAFRNIYILDDDFCVEKETYLALVDNYSYNGSNNNLAWNLEKDDFNLQSEETQLFIGELLGVM